VRADGIHTINKNIVIMGRNRTNNSTTRRRGGSKSNASSKWWILLVALIAVGAIGWIVYLITSPSGYQFRRLDLDKYVEVTRSGKTLGDGASVYLDMSGGMNYAYAEVEHQKILQAIINKLAANSAIQFYELASGNITANDMNHTDLYNYMMNRNNYLHQCAPIENTLKEIVTKEQPALLMTDFEEYKGTVIEKAAYAKKYFIEWLAAGFNITFYKWDYNEGNKPKHMFLAVFDDNANRLKSLVDNAVRLIKPDIDMYVLASRDYAYPTSSNYPSLKQGGNYHNDKGQDIVTAVLEDGGPEAYVSYAKPYATAAGKPGQFAPLDNLIGTFAEYYPLGVDWQSAIENSKRMQEVGVAAENTYKHLISNLYIDFGAQNGYLINKVEVRMFDMQKTMEEMSKQILDSSIDVNKLDAIEKPEVNEVLTASMEKVSNGNSGNGWTLINVDFDDKFGGLFSTTELSTHLFKANVVISDAQPNLDVDDFFNWDGNPSLVNSVKETLTASSSNPDGRILYTYYIRSFAK
jgi:hypothetical protein